MLSNAATFFIFVGLILVVITYKLTPFLTFKPGSKITSKNFIRKGNPTILDKIEHSDHKFELSDCINANIRCTTDDECNAICTINTPKIGWRCDTLKCKPAVPVEPIECVHGVLKLQFDPSVDALKYVCICSNPLFYGKSCATGTVGCDILKNGECLCKEGNVHFKQILSNGVHTDVCVPKIHYRLFANQPHFLQTSSQTIDWFNYN